MNFLLTYNTNLSQILTVLSLFGIIIEIIKIYKLIRFLRHNSSLGQLVLFLSESLYRDTLLQDPFGSETPQKERNKTGSLSRRRREGGE